MKDGLFLQALKQLLAQLQRQLTWQPTTTTQSFAMTVEDILHELRRDFIVAVSSSPHSRWECRILDYSSDWTAKGTTIQTAVESAALKLRSRPPHYFSVPAWLMHL